jgi:hypothetical protein
MFKRLNIETKQMEDVPINKNTALVIEQEKTQNDLTDQLCQMKIYGDKPVSYYGARENELVFDKYGAEIYNYILELDDLSYITDLLSRHKIDSSTRTKMIDWMIEVLWAYNSEPQTFFIAVHIMDLFISKCKCQLTNSDIHLLGVVCIYIASKMEDIIPLRMSNVKTNIGHNKFSEKQIKQVQKTILDIINFDIITTSTYDFIKSFFYDFLYNNNKEFKDFPDMTQLLDQLENTSVYLAKLLTHSDEFTCYKYFMLILDIVLRLLLV